MRTRTSRAGSHIGLVTISPSISTSSPHRSLDDAARVQSSRIAPFSLVLPIMAIPVDVAPSHPLDQQPTIGLIGMGAMGTMYAKLLSDAGWKKCVSSFILVLAKPTFPAPKESASAICPKNTSH